MSLVDMKDDEEYKHPSKELFVMQVAAEIYPHLEIMEAYNKILNDRKSYNSIVKEYDEWTYPNNKVQASSKEIFIYCPGCSYGFNHKLINDGKTAGGIGGASAGAILGAKIGIAMGPLGAIAGTVPGAILGAVFGNNLGNNYDKPRCPNCGTKFDIPNSLK